MISSNIVTCKDIAELTGYTTASKQKQCLDRHGIFYIEGKDGQLRTTWAHINSPLKTRGKGEGDEGFNIDAI